MYYYIINKTKDDYYAKNEFLYERKKLIKMISHPLGAPEEISTVHNYSYDKENNLIESVFVTENRIELPEPKIEYGSVKINYERNNFV